MEPIDPDGRGGQGKIRTTLSSQPCATLQYTQDTAAQLKKKKKKEQHSTAQVGVERCLCAIRLCTIVLVVRRTSQLEAALKRFE